jgi:hypothetical protein
LYFIDEKNVRRDLVEDRVSTRDAAIYLFLVFGYQLRIWYPVSVPSVDEFVAAWPDFALSLASGATTIGGFVLCYRANGADSGDNFVERFVALAWVSVVQLTLVAFPIYMTAKYIAPQFLIDSEAEIAFLLHLVFYARLWLMFLRLRADLGHAV